MTMIKEDKNIFQRGACAVGGAYTAALLTNIAKNNNPIVNSALNTLNSVPKMTTAQNDAFINNLLSNENLKNSNFKILFVTKNNNEKVTKTLIDDTLKIFNKMIDLNNIKNQKEIFEKNLKIGLEKKVKGMVDVVQKGKNAFYYPFANIAIAPTDKTIFTSHEIGHAINTNTIKNGKILLSGVRLLPKMAFIIPAIAIWQSYNNKNNEDKTFTQKHAGKIVAASFIPMLAEEALASIRAIKAGKQIKLPANILKGMKKGYALAFSTYAILAGVATGSVLLANKLFSQKEKTVC